MKNILLAALLMLGVSYQSVVRAEDVVEKEVVIGINDVYVPSGFTAQSDAFVVVNGLFPNGCYKWKRADVKSVDNLTHEISSVASVSQGMCIMVLVPFHKEVSLGKLVSGHHILRFMSGDGTYLEKSMDIQ